MNRRGWARRGIAFVGIAAMASLAFGRVAAQESVEASLYRLDAQAGGAVVSYSVVTGLQALKVTVGAPYVESAIDDSPSAQAQASAIDPGLVGALGGVLPVLGFPGGLVPPYPLTARALYPNGDREDIAGVRYSLPGTPAAEVANVGYARAEADEGVAGGRATLGRARLGIGTDGVDVGRTTLGRAGLGTAQTATTPTVGVDGGLTERLRVLTEAVARGFTTRGVAVSRAAAAPEPAIFDAGALVAEVDTRREGTGVVASARTAMADVSLLGGLISIDAVSSVADLDWRDPSSPPKNRASGNIVGVRVLGVPAEVTSDGLKFAQQGLVEALDEALEASGATLVIGANTVSPEATEFVPFHIRFDKIPPEPVPQIAVIGNQPLEMKVGAAALRHVVGAPIADGTETDGSVDVPPVGGADLGAIDELDGAGGFELGLGAQPFVPTLDSGGIDGPSDESVLGTPPNGREGLAAPEGAQVPVFLSRSSAIGLVTTLGGLMCLLMLAAGSLGMVSPGARGPARFVRE